MSGLKKVTGAFELCIGMLEYRSIARGMEATDAMLKAAPVDLLISQTISPGKYLSLIHGEVEAVRSALELGEQVGGDDVVDRLLLPNPHPELAPAIDGTAPAGPIAALGIVETLSVAAAIVCGDIAVKRAQVRLVRLGLGIGLGGKGYVSLSGAEEDVLEGVQAAQQYAADAGKLLRAVVIPQLHGDMKPYL